MFFNLPNSRVFPHCGDNHLSCTCHDFGTREDNNTWNCVHMIFRQLFLLFPTKVKSVFLHWLGFTRKRTFINLNRIGFDNNSIPRNLNSSLQKKNVPALNILDIHLKIQSSIPNDLNNFSTLCEFVKLLELFFFLKIVIGSNKNHESHSN